jgi:2-iminobutanoate/2-iminopropanoate deaminase
LTGRANIDHANIGGDLNVPKEIVRTDAAPSSSYFSQAVRAGSTIYVSGITGADPATNQLAGPSIEDQARQSIQNCRTILRAAGADLDDVVEVQVLLARPEDFAGLNEEYLKFFPENPPARSVCKLGVDIPNVLVSIKMTAYVG